MSGKLYILQCARCGVEIEVKVNRPGFCLCADCRKEARRKAYKAYRDSEKGKAGRKARQQKYKEDGRQAAWQHKWAVSEKNKAVQKRYHETHREEQNEYQRKWREANRERCNAVARVYQRKRRAEDPEKYRLKERLRYARNIERNRMLNRLRRARNLEQYSSVERRYREAHRDRINFLQRLRAAVKNNRPGARLELAKATGKLTHCPRMHVTAYPLPCGKREECRGCPHCPQGADFGAEQRQRDFSVTGGWLI